MRRLAGLLLVTFLLLGLSAANGETYIGFGGYVESQSVLKGSKVWFGGSFYNNNTEGNVKVHSMNISFVIGSGSQKLILNASETIPDDRQEVGVNETFTHAMLVKVDFDPGIYNVSIFFEVSGGSEAIRDNIYSLSNATFIIRGESNPEAVTRGILFFLAGVIGVVVILLVYNRFR